MTSDTERPELSLSEKLCYGAFRFADVLFTTMVGRFLILFYTINLRCPHFR